jgi:hypothetical protein
VDSIYTICKEAMFHKRIDDKIGCISLASDVELVVKGVSAISA